jgi:RNA polymerase sigma-70 factor (ECF subfamily)
MVRPSADCAYQVSFRASSPARTVDKKSECEEEVIHLFGLFRNPLLRYVISLGLSLHDGEEIIQEVFLALFRHLQMGKSRQNLRGWVFRVAHNLALKQRAANKKAQTMLDSDEAVARRQPDTAPNPEQQAAGNQRWQRMQAVLRVLPEQDRSCLYLRAEGLRYREIAATLGISLGSVSIALARSLARMKPVDEAYV